METTELQATFSDIASNISRMVNLLEEISQKLTPVYVSCEEITDYDQQALALFKALGWEK